MLHFIASKFARVSSKVCPNEGSDCFSKYIDDRSVEEQFVGL